MPLPAFHSRWAFRARVHPTSTEEEEDFASILALGAQGRAVSSVPGDMFSFYKDIDARGWRKAHIGRIEAIISAKHKACF